MRKYLLFILSMAFVAAGSAAVTGRGGLYFGEKSLNHSDWGALDSQSAWGIDVDVKEETWPVWVTIGYVNSRDQQTAVTSLVPYATTDVEGKTTEFHLGAKKDFFPAKRLRLSIAGGPAYIRASLDSGAAPFNSDSDSAAGVWAGADAFVFIGHLIVGLTYQYSQANVDLFGHSLDAGGTNLAFSIGIGW